MWQISAQRAMCTAYLYRRLGRIPPQPPGFPFQNLGPYMSQLRRGSNPQKCPRYRRPRWGARWAHWPSLVTTQFRKYQTGLQFDLVDFSRQEQLRERNERLTDQLFRAIAEVLVCRRFT